MQLIPENRTELLLFERKRLKYHWEFVTTATTATVVQLKLKLFLRAVMAERNLNLNLNLIQYHISIGKFYKVKLLAIDYITLYYTRTLTEQNTVMLSIYNENFLMPFLSFFVLFLDPFEEYSFC